MWRQRGKQPNTIMTLGVIPSCSEASAKVGEPLRGTAIADTDVWLLLEYPGKWEADIATTELPAVTRAWLDAATRAIPRCRVLFVRGEGRTERLAFFVVTSRPERAVFRFNVDTHEDLARLDVVAVVVRGHAAATAQGGERTRALYLVCTHGRRDACCAKRGVAFVRELAEKELDGEVWQSSHQGGHRFAATMLYLPHGIHYGRLELGDVEPIAAAHARGHVHSIDRYRGLATLSPHEQAAEAWLREELDERRFSAFERVGQTVVEAGRTRCSFRARDGVVHELTVLSRSGGARRSPSCGAAPSDFTRLDVVRHVAGCDLRDASAGG